jgi:hypothetical protein
MSRRRSLCVLALGWVYASTLALGQGAAPSSVENPRETVRKWMETQRLVYQERKDWQQQKELITARIELLRKEISDLETKIAETRKTAADSERKRAEVAAQKAGLADEASALSDRVGDFETAVRRIQPQLPQPLQEKIAPLFHRMPQDPSESKVSVAERFQNVLGILSEVTRANGEITLATEVRTLNGKPSEVKTVYLGLGQAYYLSARGEAGIGRPSADGWTWTPANDLAPRLLEVVEMLQGKAQPRFIPLPVKIL